MLFHPTISSAFTANDFTINRQSTYAVPYNAQNILVLDLTLPAPITSISLHNNGTADHTNIAKLTIWEDGASAGWDNDERVVVTLSSPPFFDTIISKDFAKRIFVTIDTNETSTIERTVQLQATIDEVVLTGFERKITFNSSFLSEPASPIAGTPEVLSANTIRWHFTDIANNEFGFKLLDGNLKVLVQKEEANLSFLDETGLQPNTEYSGRKIVAFNDRGENPVSVSSVFPSAKTLALPQVIAPAATSTEIVAAEEPEEEIVAAQEEVASAPTLLETIQTKIADLQRQIAEFIKQLDEFIAKSAATVFGALQGFLQAFFGK